MARRTYRNPHALPAAGTLSFNKATGEIAGLTPEYLQSIQAEFPGLNLRMEVTRMCCWLFCNSPKQPLEQFFSSRLQTAWLRLNKLGAVA